MPYQDWGIGIVGLGGIASQHMTAYKNLELSVVGGAEIDPERLALAKKRFELQVAVSDYRDLISMPEVKIVDVTVPHKLEIREPIIEFAARNGKAIFLQKPMSSYLEQARKLVEIVDRYRVPLMVNQNSLFVPGFMAMEKYLRDERYIGTPYYFQIENRNWFDTSDHPWYGKDERWVTADMAVHHFALIRHWFGEWSSAYALMKRDLSQRSVRGDTVSVVDVKFESGVEGLVINNWSCRSDRIRPHSREEFVIQGDGGCISGDSEDITVTTLEPTPSRIRLQISGKWFPDAFGNSMLHYIDALEQKKPFLCDAHDNLRTIALIEAAYISAKEGREVHLKELNV